MVLSSRYEFERAVVVATFARCDEPNANSAEAKRTTRAALKLERRRAARALVAGALPLLLSIALARFGVRCGFAGGETYCTAGSLLVGTLSGLVIPFRDARWQRRLGSVVSAGAIAGLAAALGCVRLGVVGEASMVAGLVLGSILGRLHP